MNVLVIGSGGREHALTWKINQSPLVEKIFCIPGNPGTAAIAENHDLGPDNLDAIVTFASENTIDLTIIGPEVPLVNGLTDALQSAGFDVFGPTKFAAQLEGSKAFSKDLMQANNIPTASYATFTDKNEAEVYIKNYSNYPVVLKADGLAAGKGVLICQDQTQALNGLNQIMLDRAFGSAGDKLLIEEFLDGDEVSIFVLCDGKDYCILPPSQDHKKIGEGDTGLNTGGMGAYTPAPLADDGLMRIAREDVIEPTLKAMAELGHPYKGLLYVGLIIVDDIPYVLEYNCRFGDPETQAVLPLVKSDLVPFFKACASGSLENMKLEILDKCALDVVISSGGYPGSYKKGLIITGLDTLSSEILVFHAGTKKENGSLSTNGGRVLNLVALGGSFQECKTKLYAEIGKVKFEDMYYRRDIAHKVLK